MLGVAKPECLPMMARYGSGLKWPDKNNPLPTDLLWGGGVRAGVTWDGTFYRDVTRYPAGGQLFWSVYLKPGSAAGIKNGFWFNFGKGFCHLQNDDPAQMLSGAAPRLWWDDGSGNPPHPSPSGPASPPGGEETDAETPASPLGGEAASPTSGEGGVARGWHLVIEATAHVTHEKVLVWEGVKAGGNDPTGAYTRIAGCDPLASLTVEAVQ